jgi:hypothetical protein
MDEVEAKRVLIPNADVHVDNGYMVMFASRALGMLLGCNP